MNASNSKSSCVLIVEDEVLVRMFAVDALEEAGFKVEQAASGAEALALAGSIRNDLVAVVIDLGLPDRPGDEVAGEILSLLNTVPILIASGRSERELKERFAGESRVGIMVKPYTGPMLVEALTALGVAKKAMA